MSNNAQKTPYVRTQNQFAERKVASALFQIGKALPCKVKSVDGQIVTVTFELLSTFTLPEVTVPVATSFYRREPIQVGDLGVVRPADTTLGGINGLGTGTATFPSTTGNLEALVWEPVANSDWDPSPDTNAYLIQGPNGFILRDTGANCTIVGDQENITVTAKTTLILQVGANNITINSSGVHITGTLEINGKPYLAHNHGGVTSGAPTNYTLGVHNP
jgi:hypothetical protein